MDIPKILKSPEGKTVEFKRDLSSLKSIIKTIIAFANTSGGTVIIGREDSGKIPGVSKIRNRVIARVFREMKLIEEWGSGYKRVVEACHRDHYSEPQWIELGTALRVVFYPHKDVPVNVPVDVPVNRRQKWFLKQIVQSKKTKASHLASHWKVSIKTAKRDISELKEREMIEFVGSPKQGYYRVKK